MTFLSSPASVTQLTNPVGPSKDVNIMRQTKRKDAADKAVQLLDSKTLQPTTMTTPQNFSENKIIIAHARAVCMT